MRLCKFARFTLQLLIMHSLAC